MFQDFVQLFLRCHPVCWSSSGIVERVAFRLPRPFAAARIASFHAPRGYRARAARHAMNSLFLQGPPSRREFCRAEFNLSPTMFFSLVIATSHSLCNLQPPVSRATLALRDCRALLPCF
ncbi:hypothetical protein N657DRAFT_102003 [Parathielavia appendiculata]|uniref:Uncharacterized protein n=1 Tax=Parathielavia appendiculata TaxID=2587402 RepID=A0AAN6TY30_9PEZI|nr:hypothetical protein N657DRAFT_102003 [Parathielavia appendiculata]